MLDKRHRENIQLNKRHRENIKINNTRNKKGNLTTDTEETQRIIRSYFKNLYPTKLKDLEEMDNFMDRYYIP